MTNNAKLSLLLCGLLLVFMSCAHPGAYMRDTGNGYEFAKKVDSGVFTPQNEDFVLTVPVNNIWAIEKTSSGLITVDFPIKNRTKETNILEYSIEWARWDKEARKSDSEITAYWNSFIPEYLEKNFSKGHYKLVYAEPFRFKGRFPGYWFLGSGTHINGSNGVIYGASIYFGHHLVILYALVDSLSLSTTISSMNEAENILPDLKRFQDYVYSLKVLLKQHWKYGEDKQWHPPAALLPDLVLE
jgi:hypothetical protein